MAARSWRSGGMSAATAPVYRKWTPINSDTWRSLEAVGRSYLAAGQGRLSYGVGKTRGVKMNHCVAEVSCIETTNEPFFQQSYAWHGSLSYPAVANC